MGNIARSCNPEYDRLYAQLEQTQIGSEREALVKQLHDMDVQRYYEIPLVSRGFVSAHLNTLKGVRSTAGIARCGISPNGGAKANEESLSLI